MSAKALLRSSLADMRRRVHSARLRSMGAGCVIEPGVSLQYPNNIELGANCRIARNAVLRANTGQCPGLTLGDQVSVLENGLFGTNEGHIHIGDRSWFGPGCLIYGNGGVDIGDDVLIAAHTSINTVSHNADRCDIAINAQGTYCAPVVIENDVWIGLNVCVLQGVRIGRGAIVGAGAVVTRDIPPWSIALGTPAQVVRRRDDAPSESGPVAVSA
ncbi:MAG: acyltransferase [Gammaproteobacteria bacterium]|nr:acyltransferase [Gammaproteobacteria bacterium]